MKEILMKLFEHRRLNKAEARDILKNMSSGRYNEAEISAFITVYLMRAISPEELEGFREALLELCIPVDLEGIESIDLCGTGGDGKNTFNISTLASFVVAAAGYKVTKHGNYGVSSTCGSSNLLEYLGYEFTNDNEKLLRQLDRSNICFMHAPFFHPAMKSVASVRKQLGVKTFFNMLGPLVNPARPTHQLVGVFSPELFRLYAYIFQKTSTNYCILHGQDGYDEISLTGAFSSRTKHGKNLLYPRDIGMPKYNHEALHGGESIEAAAAIFLDILQGNGSPAQNDVVIANAAYAIRCFESNFPIEKCIDKAKSALMSGKSYETLQNLLKG